MIVHHHPDPSTLMSYAAGSLPEALAAVVSCHIAMCPECRAEVNWLEEAGGALLDGLDGERVTSGAPDIGDAAALAVRADPRPRSSASVPSGNVPAPLVALVGPDLDAVKWRRLAPGLWHKKLPLSKGGQGDLRLIKVAPGLKLPEHGHGGQELTLLLQGAYSDCFGRYGRGDIADLDEEVEHQPVADPRDGCICLIGIVKPSRYKGWMARLLQPLVGV